MQRKYLANHTGSGILLSQDPELRRVVHEALLQVEITLTDVEHFDDLLTIYRNARLPDFVILDDRVGDVTLEGSAFQWCEQLKSLPGAEQVAVFLLVDPAEDEEKAAVRTYEAGANDYFTRPLNPVVMAQRIRHSLTIQAQQRSLQAQISRYHRFNELSSDFTYEYTVESDAVRLCWASGNLLSALGCAADETAGLDWRQLVHPDDRERVDEHLERLQAGDVHVCEFRVQPPGGETFWVREKARPIYDEHQDTASLFAVSRDITEEKRLRDRRGVAPQVENLMRERDETLAILGAFFETAPVGMAFFDREARYRKMNQALANINGLPISAHIGRAPQDLLPDVASKNAQDRFQQVLQTGDALSFEVSGETSMEPGVVHHWLASYFPVRLADDLIGVGAILQDITERKRAEEALRLSEETLRRQTEELRTRNEELDAFAYTAAHDLKNPVSSMIGFASVVQNYIDRMERDDILECINNIVADGYKVTQIIDALLLLARVNRIDLSDQEDIDNKALLDEVHQRLGQMIDEYGADIRLTTDLPPVRGYAPWIEEIWVNYISNAIKYGGRPPVVEIGAEQQDDGMVRFWVKDNGRGLSQQQQQRLFTPFTRLHEARAEGHGLGLSIVQRIVKRLGGQVGVQSREGEGSTFSFTLPAVEAADG